MNMWGKGGGTLLKKGFLLPSPNPSPSPPKTFNWWGGNAEGVLLCYGVVIVVVQSGVMISNG